MMLTNVILVVIVLGFLGAGWKDGFIHTLGRLVGAVLGFLAARAWSGYLATVLGVFIPVGWAKLGGFLLIFLVATWAVGFVFKLLDGAYRILSILPFLKSLNSFLGALLGIVEGLILVGGVIYLVVTFNLIPWLATLFSTSVVATWVLTTFNLLLGILL